MTAVPLQIIVVLTIQHFKN